MTLEKLLELVLMNPGGSSLLLIIFVVFAWNAITTYHLSTRAVTKNDLELAIAKLEQNLNGNMEKRFVTTRECSARHASENA